MLSNTGWQGDKERMMLWNERRRGDSEAGCPAAGRPTFQRHGNRQIVGWFLSNRERENAALGGWRKEAASRHGTAES